MLGRFSKSICGGVLAATLLTGWLVTGCCLDVDCNSYAHVETAALYSLEIVNRTSDRVRVRVKIRGDLFRGIDPGQHERYREAPILTLESDEMTTFRMSAFGGVDSDEDGLEVRRFSRIHFYDSHSDIPYRSYAYHFSWCGSNSACWESEDDTLIEYTRTDGVKETLFVESPDRPFYLERDGDDLELGRIVITFVPDAEPVDQESDGASVAGE